MVDTWPYTELDWRALSCDKLGGAVRKCVVYCIALHCYVLWHVTVYNVENECVVPCYC